MIKSLIIMQARLTGLAFFYLLHLPKEHAVAKRM
jgi:hypothetical protein